MNSARVPSTCREPAFRARYGSARPGPARGGRGTLQRYLRTFVDPLQHRLLDGVHLTLFGPRGGGKSSVLRALEAQLRDDAVPCAYVSVTGSLEHITHALECAYPAVATAQLGRRAARYRLWSAADQQACVLLLDHFSCTGSAMVSFLRRLHRRIAGVLTAVDIENEAQRRALRAWRYGALTIRMPAAPTATLRRLLAVQAERLQLPALDSRVRTALVAAARGRPGWIVSCAELAREPRYWGDQGLLLSVLCVDTEAVVRYDALPWLVAKPRADPRAPVGGD